MLFIKIPLPNQKSITHRRISILQVINERLNIRLLPKLSMSLSKVYVNQGGVDRFFLISEVNLLFYIITGNSQHKTGKLHSQAQYFREMKSKTLILPEVSFLLMIQIFDNTVNGLWRSC